MFVLNNWVNAGTIYSGRGDWGTNECVRKQEFCCRHYNFDMRARHVNVAAEEAVEFTGALLGCLEVSAPRWHLKVGIG